MKSAITHHKTMYIFFGAPGAGKGTLAQLCVEKLGWKQLSTGELCRYHSLHHTEIGKQIDFLIKSGKLVSDSLITSMVEDWLLRNSKGNQEIILDGFPRTAEQAQMLDELLKKDAFSSFKLVIVSMAVPNAVVLQRLTHRWVCSNPACQAIYSLPNEGQTIPSNALRCPHCSKELIRRQDDQNMAVIEERLKTFNHHAQALMNYYKSTGCTFYELDATKPVIEVFEQLMAKLKER